MREFAVYTGLRVLLFLAAFAVILGPWSLVVDDVGQDDVFICVALGFLASGIASYFVLERPRAAFAQRVEARAARAAAAFEQRKAREDVE